MANDSDLANAAADEHAFGLRFGEPDMSDTNAVRNGAAALNAPSRSTPPMPHRLEVSGRKVAELTAALSDAVAVAQSSAIQRGSFGVLVRRHAYDRFTVEVSPEVPFGMTMERDDLN